MTEHHLQSLAELAPAELREIMFDRLHGLTSLGPPTDPRTGDPPYTWLVDVFDRLADGGLQRRMTAIAGDFLEELVDTERWPRDARANLLDYVQHCGHGLIEDLINLIRAETLLHGLGAPAHAGLLKCIMALGHRESPRFWIEQLEATGDDYGGLIFAALLDHGLDVAVEQLPRLARSVAARDAVVVACIDAIDRFGQTPTFEAIENRMALDPNFGQDFRQHLDFLKETVGAESRTDGSDPGNGKAGSDAAPCAPPRTFLSGIVRVHPEDHNIAA